jgi:hypothetical protein
MRTAFAVAKTERPAILVSARAIASREAKITMALHRDIYWVGKQWAVTGYGIQACDQKKKGQFDIEASRLWKDGVLESLRAEPWLNREDFDKALAAARKHYPEPPRKAATPVESVSPPPESPPVEPPKPAAQPFVGLRIEGGSAKFLPLWRIRIRR